MKPKREAPSIVLRKDQRGAVPASAYDAEQWESYALGTEFELRPMTRRSWPQLKLYFSVLSRVVAATDIAPTALHLHDLIKVELGYVTLVKLLDGSVAQWPDSAALSSMDAKTFSGFFDRAMQLLAERCGFDPLDALKDAA